MDPKKKETNQQTESLTLFLKPETDPKNEELDPNKEETNQQTENLKLFQNRKRTQKKVKRINKMRI